MGTAYEALSCEPIRQIARQELKKRGNPSYNPSAYLDEDAWTIVVVDGYDTRGNLWRVSEHTPQLLYEIPSCVANGSIFYDLVAGRYVITPAFNEEKEPLYEHLGTEARKVADDKGLFRPDDLRRMGKR